MCMLFLPFCIVMRIIVHHVLSCYCKDFSGLSEILIKILLIITYFLTYFILTRLLLQGSNYYYYY